MARVVTKSWRISIICICYVQIQSNETAVWSVYDVKWELFKLIFFHLKMLAYPWLLLCSIPRVRAFRWSTVWHSTSRGIKTTRSLISKIPKSLLLLSKAESLNLKVVAVLMPLEINHLTVPHLKALTHSIKHKSGHGHGSILRSATLSWKALLYFIIGPNDSLMWQ